ILAQEHIPPQDNGAPPRPEHHSRLQRGFRADVDDPTPPRREPQLHMNAAPEGTPTPNPRPVPPQAKAAHEVRNSRNRPDRTAQPGGHRHASWTGEVLIDR